MHKLNYFLLSVFCFFMTLMSCSVETEPEEFRFNLEEKDSLESQFSEFIIHLKTENHQELQKYRCDTVLWWNMGLEKYGDSCVIDKNFSLGNILELSNLGFDSLVVHGDTVGVAYNRKELVLEYNGKSFTRWQYFDFIMKDGKISEILRFNTYDTKMADFIALQRTIKVVPSETKYNALDSFVQSPKVENQSGLNRQITIGGFYMDDTEITSNDYRGSTYSQYCEMYKVYPDDYDTAFQERKSKRMYEELSDYHYLNHDSTGNFSLRVESLKKEMKAKLETFWANFPVSLASISVESMSANSFRTRELKGD